MTKQENEIEMNEGAIEAEVESKKKVIVTPESEGNKPMQTAGKKKVVEEELDVEAKTKKDDEIEDEDDEDDKDLDESAEHPLEVEYVAERIVPEISSIELNLTEATSPLFEGTEISEEAKERISTLFEAYLTSQVSEILESAETVAQERLAEQVSVIKADLVENLDEYAGYVVEEWVAENQVAIDAGLKVEAALAFFDDIKAVMEKHNYVLPEGTDLLEKAEGQLAEAKALAEERQTQIDQLNSELLEMKKEKVLDKFTEGLAATQVEKLLKLVEGIEANDIETFEKKVKIVKESIFESAPVEKEKPLVEEKQPEAGVSKLMAGLSRLNKKD